MVAFPADTGTRDAPLRLKTEPSRFICQFHHGHSFHDAIMKQTQRTASLSIRDLTKAKRTEKNELKRGIFMSPLP